jgi:thymidylate synthase (FAD)
MTTISLYEKSKVLGYVTLEDYMGTALTPVNAARVSFNNSSEELTDKDKKLIQYLIKEKHTSPFEHNLITFKFKVPLFVARQHMRHRTWSFNEVSRRYTSLDIDFYQPCLFRTQHKNNRQASNSTELIDPTINLSFGEFSYYSTNVSDALKKHIEASFKLYEDMLDAGICREQARMVLPQNMYTTYIGTVNLNNLIKFIKLRDHEGAQEEIKEVALACKQIAYNLWPQVMESLM